ncbi:enoyl-CoA hydratase/isomerase family protein [Saccharopolyspora hattusasensis]|uniref:enoyl-CoA hydratase/isomerase family protein n=1 Tax=Saccharopolyspora hattusasensis TaxID=1128679 RepID=UPI003D958C92
MSVDTPAPIIVAERHASVLLLTLNRPRQANALNSELAAALERHVELLERGDDTRALVIIGSGEKAFCAGADIHELADLDEDTARTRMRRVQDLFRRLELLPVPVIAAVNGYALGGGLELAMACDLRVAGRSARFGQPEILLGNIPGWAGTQRLPRLVGLGTANELIFTGQQIGADEAHRIGLVNRVVADDQILSTAMALADQLAAKSPAALSGAKRAIHIGLDKGLSEGQLVEADAVAACCQTDMQRQLVADFLNKRAARTA